MSLLRQNSLLRYATLIAMLSGCLAWSGCTSTNTAAKIPLDAFAKLSPVPEVSTPYQAVEGAKEYVRTHPGSDFAVGSGDSMLPYYRDRDVIVLERPSLSDLKLGETVVFLGESGVPVAHVIIARSSDGWITMGAANTETDSGTVSEANYMGIVVKAYRPTGSPILAYWATSPENPLAANSAHVATIEHVKGANVGG